MRRFAVVRGAVLEAVFVGAAVDGLAGDLAAGLIRVGVLGDGLADLDAAVLLVCLFRAPARSALDAVRRRSTADRILSGRWVRILGVILRLAVREKQVPHFVRDDSLKTNLKQTKPAMTQS